MRLISSALNSSPRMRRTSRRIKFHRSEIQLARDHVDHVADQRAAAGRENQFGDAVRRRDSRFEIGAALEAMRRIGVNAVPLRHAAHGDRIPPRRLDQDVFRLLRDHRVEAAHHARQPDGLFGVRDDEIFGGELAFDSIERLERLAGSRFADDELSALEQIEIENVRRLAAFPQNVVRGIDRIADGPLIEQLQAIRNLRGRRLDRDAANFAGGETRTKLGLLNVDDDVGLALAQRAVSAQSAAAADRRAPTLRAPRHSDSWHRDGWS